MQPVEREIPRAQIQRRFRAAGITDAPGVAVVDFQHRRTGHIVVKGDRFRAVSLQGQLHAGVQRPDIQPPLLVPPDTGAGGRREKRRARGRPNEHLASGHIGQTAPQRPFPILRHSSRSLRLRLKLLLVFANKLYHFFLSEQPDFRSSGFDAAPEKC